MRLLALSISLTLIACGSPKPVVAPSEVSEPDSVSAPRASYPRMPKTCEENYPGMIGEELIMTVPITLTYPWNIQTLFRSEVTVEADSRTLLVAQAEFTNDVGYNVMLGIYIRKSVNGGNWTYVTQPAGTNITPDTHHHTVWLPAIDTNAEAGRIVYEVVVYSASTGAKPNHFLSVEQCYGSFETEIF